MPEPGATARRVRHLLALAVPLALAVVTLGAYVRLSDAGLGCPDWPGCYGQLVGVPATDSAGNPVPQGKAWLEVAHRYLAGTLGLLVLATTALAWAGRIPRAQRLLVTLVLVLVVFQAGLGALTVTKLLRPVVVTAHLLGGLAIVAVLAAYAVRSFPVPGFRQPGARGLGPLLAVAGSALALQVALGGWVSSNYAGLACGNTLLTCNGAWLAPMDTSAFALDRELGEDATGQPLTQRALATVHWAHRAGAVMVTLLLGAVCRALWHRRRRAQAMVLGGILLLQLALGMQLVLSGLPLSPSLLHNTVAALLCAALAATAAVSHRVASPAS